MFNPLKLKHRIKIVIALALALLLSFLFFIKPKENKHIPTMPIAMVLDLTQNADNTLTVDTIEVLNRYSPDYQSDIQFNYYQIEIKKNDEILFTGKLPKKNIMIAESFGENPQNKITLQDLEEFQLYLPYYNNATTLVITEDNGKEALQVDLTSKKLHMPKIQNACGDGICTDNESLLMCYTDCKHLLPK